MQSLSDSGDSYWLIVTRRNASEILLSEHGSGWALPCVSIRPRQRVAEQLVSQVSGEWRLETYCLFVANSPHSGRNEEAKYAVMETVRQNDKAPDGTCWMSPSALAECGDARDLVLIKEALEELESYVRGEKAGPFARPGWLRELFRWTEEQVAPLGLRVTGGFRQWNASPTFSLVRMETNDGALWFKATGEPNAHELSVSLLLARLFPNHVLRILGIHRPWNGWLSAEASGTALDEISDCSTWERVAAELAELQIASIGKGSDLLAGKENSRSASEPGACFSLGSTQGILLTSSEFWPPQYAWTPRLQSRKHSRVPRTLRVSRLGGRLRHESSGHLRVSPPALGTNWTEGTRGGCAALGHLPAALGGLLFSGGSAAGHGRSCSRGGICSRRCK
jgi:hypothetical protein